MKKYKVAFICLSLIFVAGQLNILLNELQYDYDKSGFPKGHEAFLNAGEQFWNPAISYENKFKDYPTDMRPRFFLSTGYLAIFTDGWNLIKKLIQVCYHLAIILPLIYLYRFPRWMMFTCLLPLNLFFGFAFSVMYSYTLAAKQPRYSKEHDHEKLLINS